MDESDGSDEPTIMQFFAAMERGDMESAAGFVHDDFTMNWPQSGERFRGKADSLAALQATPEKPELAGEPRVVGEGNVWVLMMPLRYGSEIHHYAGVFELEDGKIRRSTEFFGAPFPAQPARAQFTDKG
jgi:ketosteroid isomerase-like protein